ncbi:hypothetical protein ACSQ67_019994 [Phaseolus vulgaris]
MAGEEGGGKKRVVTESLGWLTESSIMPKKHRAIEGVGASSIVELKAELYKSQEDSRKSRELSGPDVEYQRAKNIIAPKDLLSVKNRGVDARAHKDKLELKAVRDGTASYAALERKAELYEKLVKGSCPTKRIKRSIFNLKSVGPGRTVGAFDTADYKRNIREVHEEVNRAREKASEIKLRRQEQVAAHREKLKQAYLRKKLEQLKASSVISGSESKQT